jgi:tripartite-type tricarboxylate transporter receptor subunit TctC
MNSETIVGFGQEPRKLNGDTRNPPAVPLLLAFLVFLFSVSTFVALALAEPAPFYRGKTIRIVVGTSSGSLNDQWAQVLARTMPKHIPGKPKMIVQNMPGITGIVAANFGSTVAAPDGLTLVIVQRHVYLEQLIEREEAKFDLRRFHWIGSPDKSVPVLFIRSDSPYKSVDDILKSADPPKCGASSRSDLTFSMNKVMEVALGGAVNLIVGYSAGARVDAAIERSEVVCRVTSLDVYFDREPFQNWNKTGFVRHLLVFGPKRDPRIPNVPLIDELMEQKRTPELNRRIAEVILAGNRLGRPLVAPPGTSPEAVKILRTAYMNLFRDPYFLAEVKRLKIATDPSTGEELQDLVRQVMEQPADLIGRLKILMTNPPSL